VEYKLSWEERLKKKRKWEVKGKNKCKIEKNKGKEGMLGVEKRHVVSERKI
jgi:hypothetical protein